MSFVLEALKSVKRDISEPFGYQIINYGGEALYVEGFIRIGVIEREKTEFLLRRGMIVVEGRDLEISVLTEGTCLIEGKITSVREECDENVVHSGRSGKIPRVKKNSEKENEKSAKNNMCFGADG